MGETFRGPSSWRHSCFVAQTQLLPDPKLDPSLEPRPRLQTNQKVNLNLAFTLILPQC